VHDVAVLHDVGLALLAQLAGGLERGLAAVLLEVGERVDTLARMKPFSKSVWITPAASGASAPLRSSRRGSPSRRR
jgi:hypothetical protein